MDIKYGIIAIPLRGEEGSVELLKKTPLNQSFLDDLKLDILHFVGYEKVPTMYCYLSLYAELEQEQEFGLYGQDFVLIPAPDDLVEQYREMIGASGDQCCSDEYVNALSED